MQAAASHRPIQIGMKAAILLRTALSLLCPLLFVLLCRTPPWRRKNRTGAVDHGREELGVNPFTAPSVADIFQQLDDLKPLPFEQLKREFPQATHSSREQMGLVFGGLVADGFLIVECQKQNLVEDLGRRLAASGAQPRRGRPSDAP